jgi:hypothetical protein
MNENSNQNIPKVEIYFDFDTSKEILSAENWYRNACEILYVQRQIETEIKTTIEEQNPDPIVIAQDFINIKLNGLDALGSLSKVYMYLSGIIFENLTKSIIIQKTPDKLKAITEGARAHNVSFLMQLAGFKLSKEDEFLFERITSYIVWAGRYSHPKIKEKKGHTSGRVKFTTEDIPKINKWLIEVNYLANKAVYLEKA